MIKHLASQMENFVYLDLENPIDRNKLQDPMLFFTANRNKTICLNEVQRVPEIFSTLRSVIVQSKFRGNLSYLVLLHHNYCGKHQRASPGALFIIF